MYGFFFRISQLIILLAPWAAASQTNVILSAPKPTIFKSVQAGPNGGTGHSTYSSCFLVTADDLKFMPAGVIISSFGYTFASQNSTVNPTGTFTLYLENTTDQSYQKGSNLATALNTMAVGYASVMTLSLSAGTTTLALSTPFNYTGGGLYVGCRWSQPNGPYSTPIEYYTHPFILNPGGYASQNGSSLYRPSFLFGFTNPFSNDLHIDGISTQGIHPITLGSSATPTVHVRNTGSLTVSNATLYLNVSGGTLYNDTIAIPPLSAGSQTTLQFSGYVPQSAGMTTLTALLSSDEYSVNNVFKVEQKATCNEVGWPTPSWTFTSGIGGTGIFTAKYSPAVNHSLSAIRVAIAQHSTTPGASIRGVLLTSTGNTLATTSSLVLTSTMQATWQDLEFSGGPQQVNIGTDYLLGIAILTPSLCYPLAVQPSEFLPPGAYGGASQNNPAVFPDPYNLWHYGLTGVITVSNPVTVNNATITCGDSTVLTANGALSYTWNTGAVSATTSAAPLNTSTFIALGTTSAGCIFNKASVVHVLPINVLSKSSASSICAGDSVMLYASGASQYVWIGEQATSDSIYVSPTSSHVYTVAGTNSNGCSNTSTTGITVNTFTYLIVDKDSISLCAGQSTTLMASGADSYTWTGPSTFTNNPQLILKPATQGIYTVTGSGNNGCTMARTVQVQITTIPLKITTLGQPCDSAVIQLHASGASSYMWDGFFPFPVFSITATAGSHHTLTATSGSCSATTVHQVTVHPKPHLTITSISFTACTGQELLLNASGAHSYTWMSGNTKPVFSISPPASGQYTITVQGEDINGCYAQASQTITIEECVSVEELSLSGGIRISPNPSSGIFNFYSRRPVTAILQDIYGNTVGSAFSIFKNATIDFTFLPAGCYFLVLQDKKGGLTTRRLIKQ